MDINLTTRRGLEHAAGLNSLLNRPLVHHVVLPSGLLSDKDQREAEYSIKSLFNDCGCAWGAPIFITAMLAAGIFIGLFSVFTWPKLGIAVAISIPAAFLGKLAGLIYSYHRLNYYLSQIKSMLELKYGQNQEWQIPELTKIHAED